MHVLGSGDGMHGRAVPTSVVDIADEQSFDRDEYKVIVKW